MARHIGDFMERVPRRIIIDTQYSLFRLNFRHSDITVGHAFSSASSTGPCCIVGRSQKNFCRACGILWINYDFDNKICKYLANAQFDIQQKSYWIGTEEQVFLDKFLDEFTASFIQGYFPWNKKCIKLSTMPHFRSVFQNQRDLTAMAARRWVRNDVLRCDILRRGVVEGGLSPP